MRINSILAALAAASMAAAPVIAAPKPAAEVAPRSETVQGEQIRGGFLLPLAIIIALLLGVLLLTKDEEPASP